MNSIAISDKSQIPSLPISSIVPTVNDDRQVEPLKQQLLMAPSVNSSSAGQIKPKLQWDDNDDDVNDTQVISSQSKMMNDCNKRLRLNQQQKHQSNSISSIGIVTVRSAAKYAPLMSSSDDATATADAKRVTTVRKTSCKRQASDDDSSSNSIGSLPSFIPPAAKKKKRAPIMKPHSNQISSIVNRQKAVHQHQRLSSSNCLHLKISHSSRRSQSKTMS